MTTLAQAGVGNAAKAMVPATTMRTMERLLAVFWISATTDRRTQQ